MLAAIHTDLPRIRIINIWLRKAAATRDHDAFTVLAFAKGGFKDELVKGKDPLTGAAWRTYRCDGMRPTTALGQYLRARRELVCRDWPVSAAGACRDSVVRC